VCGFSCVCAVYNIKPKAHMAEGRTGVAEAGTGISAGSAFLSRDFGLYQTARLLVILGSEAQYIAVTWQVYQITHHSPFYLGLTGLTLFAPGFFFMLAAGHVADRYDRRSVILACYSLQALCTLALIQFALHPTGHVGPIYAVLFGVGTGRAFSSPASAAFLPGLVPSNHFVNAFIWG
jgi:MFS family permease